MSGSLILIDSETASSSPSISLTGMDSTYDVYMATISGAKHSANAYDYFRLTAGGTPVTSANYRAGGQVLRTAGAYYNMSQINATFVYLSPYTKSTTAGDQTNAVIYIFGSQVSDKRTYATFEETSKGTSLFGVNGGMQLNIAEVHDGVNFSVNTGNYTTGEFKLFGLKK